MANNVIKVGTSNDGLSIQQGSFAMGAAGLGDYGPTSRTNYYAGIDVPEGGYVFYRVDGNGNINPNVAHDDTQAMFFLQSYGATGTTLNEMLSWAAASGDVVGLSADITTSEVITANGTSGSSGSSGSSSSSGSAGTSGSSSSSGSAGTSGSSGSSGGTRFPRAWFLSFSLISNEEAAFIEAHQNYYGRLFYTRESQLPSFGESGIYIYSDASLTTRVTTSHKIVHNGYRYHIDTNGVIYNIGESYQSFNEPVGISTRTGPFSIVNDNPITCVNNATSTDIVFYQPSVPLGTNIIWNLFGFSRYGINVGDYLFIKPSHSTSSYKYVVINEYRAEPESVNNEYPCN